MLKNKKLNSEIVTEFFDNAIKNVKKSPKGKQFKIRVTDDVTRILDMFLNGQSTSGKAGKYEIDGNSLVYRSIVTTEIRLNSLQLANAINAIKSNQMVLVDQKLEDLEDTLSKMVAQELAGQKESGGWSRNVDTTIKVKVKKQDICAIRLLRNNECVYLGNSSVLGLIGRTVSFGNERLNRDETDIQREMSLLIPMLPFSVFAQAKLDINTLEIVERGKAETVTRKVFVRYDRKTEKEIFKDETRHFTGASLFTVGGEMFLFDLDRRELEHKIFNPFLVKLPVKVRTIDAAYHALKPSEVLEAEKQGMEVLRQGEWFFIPVSGEYTPDKGRDGRDQRIELRAGRNRPNYVQHGVAKLMLCKGEVTHAGREHAPLMLKQWYKAVPNTSTESFTIQGDID